MKLSLLLLSLALSAMSVQAQDNLPTTIIREQPAGKLHDNQARSSYYYYTLQGGVNNVAHGIDAWSVSRFVEGDDGCIYLYNPYSQLPIRSWLKLDPAGNGRYVAKLPQLIRIGVRYDDEGNESPSYYYAFPVKEYEKEDGTTFCKTDTLADGTVKSELNFVMRNDSLIMTDDDFLGLVNNKLRWTGYADTDIKVGAVKYTPNTLPEGVKLQDYRLTYTDKANSQQDAMVKLGFEGDKAYLLNPYNNDSTEVIVGTLEEGNKLSFPTRQYLGANWKVTHHVFFMAKTYEREGQQINYGTWIPKLTFNIDAEKRTLTTDSKNVIIINAGDVLQYALAYYFNPSLTAFNDVPRVPQTPTIDTEQSFAVTDMYDGTYGGLTFLLQKYDAEGNYLDASKSYYRIYADNGDKPYTFTPSVYKSLKASLTDVPFSYIDNQNFFSYALPGDNQQIERSVSFYDANVKRWGVQAVYKGGGEERVSSIAWWSTTATDIQSVGNQSRKAVRTDYYDLSGRRLSQPSHGMGLKVTTFSDGSRTTVKSAAR